MSDYWGYVFPTQAEYAGMTFDQMMRTRHSEYGKVIELAKRSYPDWQSDVEGAEWNAAKGDVGDSGWWLEYGKLWQAASGWTPDELTPGVAPPAGSTILGGSERFDDTPGTHGLPVEAKIAGPPYPPNLNGHGGTLMVYEDPFPDPILPGLPIEPGGDPNKFEPYVMFPDGQTDTITPGAGQSTTGIGAIIAVGAIAILAFALSK